MGPRSSLPYCKYGSEPSGIQSSFLSHLNAVYTTPVLFRIHFSIDTCTPRYYKLPFSRFWGGGGQNFGCNLSSMYATFTGHLMLPDFDILIPDEENKLRSSSLYISFQSLLLGPSFSVC